MVSTIVLQKHSMLSPSLTITGSIGIVMALAYSCGAENNTDRIIGLIFLLLLSAALIPAFTKRYFFMKKGYASVLQVSEDKIRIVYEYASEKKVTIISSNDIKSFKVLINSGMASFRTGLRFGPSRERVYKIKIVIETPKSSIELDVHPGEVDPSGNLDFMYPLLDASHMIPNFSYKIEGDAFLMEVFEDYTINKRVKTQ